MQVTIFKSVHDSNNPHYIHLEKALQRIKEGASKEKVQEIRDTIDKEKRNLLKVHLPSVLFSGKFSKATNEAVLEYTNMLVLDFDNISEHPNIDACEKEKKELCKNKNIYACWISPSGNGLKALVKISNGKKHEDHFAALQDTFTNLDKSGKNIARHCFESYDPNIYINEKAEIFNKIKKYEVVIQKKEITDKSKNFENILKWLANKGDAFVKGERNVFVFKLASACCRFGIDEESCFLLFKAYLGNDHTFGDRELSRTIKSAFKSSYSSFGTATFENDVLIHKETRSEITTKEINPDIYNEDIKPKDVIFGEDVRENAIKIYDNGYDKVNGIGVSELDEYFKMKRGEITLMTGIGNYGKSSFLKWFILMRIIKFGEKFALFTPEDNPAEEFYHDLVEIYLGCNCTPFNANRPSKEKYTFVYDYISKHFFYVYPKEIAPSPDYIKERFLELVIKEKIVGCVIDPFNQMANDYNSSGGRSDKYLETFLSDCSRFAQLNNVYFIIVAHPKLLRKDDKGNYPCPDVYDVADGAMWNNKMDNILVYHRPNHQLNPQDTLCEFHTKKIRRQKTVGKKGFITFDLDRSKRRYVFDGKDYMGIILKEENAIEKEFNKYNDYWNNLINDKTNEVVPF